MATRDDQALVEKVLRLEADPAISLADVDLTIVNPERLRRQFDEVFYYFALVEGEVAQNAVDITSMLPGLDDNELRFLAAWSAHEVAHSALFDAIRIRLDLPTEAPVSFPRVQQPFRAVGMLATFRWFHDVLKHVYLARGAMHERLTQEAYTRLGTKLSKLGEFALARTIIDPIIRQEASHLGYYRAAAAAHRLRLTAIQLYFARTISARTYAPVGAKRSRRALCGRVFTDIAGDDIQGLGPIEAIANQLLGNGRHWDACFVRGAMNKCLASGGML